MNALGKDKPTSNGGRPKFDRGVEPVTPNLLLQSKDRPTNSGGRPKRIAAVYNLIGNSFMRQANQQPALIDTAIVNYCRAFEFDSNDLGLMINLAVANLVKGEASVVTRLFSAVFELSQRDLKQLYAMLELNPAQFKFPEGHRFHKAEEILRAAIKTSVEPGGTIVEANSISAEPGGAIAEANSISSEEAKEFLYIKRLDIEEE